MVPGAYDLGSSLERLSAELTQYYLLSYIPSEDAADRPCHKLVVKVDRKGLDVNARDSYCTASQPMSQALKQAQRAIEARVEAGDAGNLAIGLHLSWFYSEPGSAVVDIAMDVDPRAARISKLLNRLHGEIGLLGMLYREDGVIATRFGDNVKLDFDTPAQLDEFLKVPYHY